MPNTQPSGAKLVAIAGGTGAGKSTLTKRLAAELGETASVVHLDAYFRPGSSTFNRPEAIDIERALADLDCLRAGQSIQLKNRAREVVEIVPRPIILLDGHLALCYDALVERLALSIYVDLDADVRAVRRLVRNVDQAGGRLADVAAWYLRDAKSGHEQYIEPSKRRADLIIWGDLKDRSVELVLQLIRGL